MDYLGQVAASRALGGQRGRSPGRAAGQAPFEPSPTRGASGNPWSSGAAAGGAQTPRGVGPDSPSWSNGARRKSSTPPHPAAAAPPAGPESAPRPVLLSQAEGYPTVRVFMAPEQGAPVAGEIPSGERGVCIAESDDFLYVRWGYLAGWCGRKNGTFPGQDEARAPWEAAPPVGLGRVVLRQAEGFPAVRVFEAPEQRAAVVGEIPSGEVVDCIAESSDFVYVRRGAVSGWCGRKNTASHWPPAEEPPLHGGRAAGAASSGMFDKVKDGLTRTMSPARARGAGSSRNASPSGAGAARGGCSYSLGHRVYIDVHARGEWAPGEVISKLPNGTVEVQSGSTSFWVGRKHQRAQLRPLDASAHH